MERPSPAPVQPARLTVVGLGYVGCVTAACLADLGHRVAGVDKDQPKVDAILAGQAPFYEPGLDELVARCVSRGRLVASTRIEDALADAEVALIAVGTPSERNGNLNLDQLRRVCREIAGTLEHRREPLTVAVRSTVFPGVCESELTPLLGDHARLVSNPEFLREGNAVRDFFEPSLVVVGGSDAAAVDQVAGLYAPLGVAAARVSLRTAEMIKYACNAYHALKIAFANEIGALCGPLEVSAREVMDTLCRDVKLNLSSAYLKPGFAFGGSCLPKDLRALAYRSARLDLRLPLVEAILPSNTEHLARAVREVLEFPPAERIGIYGLTFKPNTDDLRESPAVALMEQLIGRGRQIRVFDPHFQLNRVYGTNRSFLLSAIPHIERLVVDSLEALLAWSQRLVIAQEPSPEVAAAISGSGMPLRDLVRGGSHQLPA